MRCREAAAQGVAAAVVAAAAAAVVVAGQVEGPVALHHLHTEGDN
jgi:hypothetical protein